MQADPAAVIDQDRERRGEAVAFLFTVQARLGGLQLAAGFLDRDLGFGHVMVGLEPISVRSVERLAEAVRLARAS